MRSISQGFGFLMIMAAVMAAIIFIGDLLH